MSDQNNTDWIGLARDAYSASNTYFDASIRNGIEQDLRQFQSLHPANSKYLVDGRGRSKLFRPKTRAVIRKNEAAAAEAFFSTNDVVSISPEDDNDPVKRASAAVMQELLQYRLTKTLPWFQTVIGAYQDAQTVGVVASYQSWIFNPVKGIDQPDIRLIPIENLRFDSAANWTDPVGTSPYIIELIPMYIKDVRARMQNPDPKTGEPKWKLLDESQILQATRNYSDTIRLQREGPQRTDSKTQSQAVNAFNVVWVHKNVIEVDGVDWVFYTLGTEQLLSDPVPLSQQYFHGKRPYVVGCAVIETHKLYPSSVPRLTKDTQAEINEIANQRIDNVKLVLNKRYFARRNKQVDLRSITKNVPGSVTLMQDTDDVKAVEFNDVTASSYKEQEVLNLDFDDIAGAFSGSSVQSNRKLNETVGGMQMLDTNANQVSGYQLRTFVETWVEPVLRQLVMLEQFYETDETLIGLCGQQAQIVQKFGVDAITDDMLMSEFTLNVNVGLGATNPSQQVDRFIQAMTSLRAILADNALIQYGLNVQEVIKELFGKLGYKDGGRFFDTDKQDPQIMYLESMVQQLQQALEAKVDPKLVAAQIRKIDAEIASMGVKDKKETALTVKTGVEAAFSAMQGAEVIAAVPQVAPIADELMRSAGYRLPTPPGIDPNFPQPAMPAQLPAPGLGGGGGSPVQGYNPQQTTLDPTQPPTPGIGVRAGIETQRPDSVGLANGGAIARYVNGGLLDASPTREQLAGVAPMPAPRLQPGGQMNVLMQGAQSLSQEGGVLGGLMNSAKGLMEGGFGGQGGGYMGAATDQLNDLRNSAHSLLDPNASQEYLSVGGLANDFTRKSSIAGFANGGLLGDEQISPLDGLTETQRLGIKRLQQQPLQPNQRSITLPAGLSPSQQGSELMDLFGKGADAGLPGDQLNALRTKASEVANPGYSASAPIGHTVSQFGGGSLMDDFGGQGGGILSRFADGGLIVGPGTGTSDSIAAEANGQPLAVSNGEFLVPPEVVQALGQDFFEALITRFHTPVAAPDGAMPATDNPLRFDDGSFIVPSDVVAALGEDFFHKLIEHYGPTA